MFSSLVVCYLFLGGTGAGALVVLGVLEFLKRSRALAPRIPDDLFLPREVFARAWPLCFVLLATAVLCLFADLGRPERVWGLVLHPQLSAMTVGAFALAGALACAGVFSVLVLFDNVRPPRLAGMGLAWLSVATGGVSAAYTGVLLQNVAAVLLWQTPLLPLLFVASSLSCGVAVVLLATVFVETRMPFLRVVSSLTLLDSAFLLVEGVLLALWLGLAAGDAGTAPAVHELVAGALRWPFWGVLVVAGMAVPFAMERFVSYGNYRSQVLWTAGLLLVGGLALRFCVAEAGLYDVTQTAGILAASGGFALGVG